MNDVLDAIAGILEPGTASPSTDSDGSQTRVATSGVVVDLNASEPMVYRTNHLYLWTELDQYNPEGAGSPQISVREDFQLIAVFAGDAGEEEAQQQRTRAVSDALDAKATAYLAAIAANRSRFADLSASPWQHLQAVVDHDLARLFNVRSVAVRITGYRFR